MITTAYKLVFAAKYGYPGNYTFITDEYYLSSIEHCFKAIEQAQNGGQEIVFLTIEQIIEDSDEISGD